MAEFTGERVIPGQVDENLLNEHLARYCFASRLARGKRVLDAGCGAGYGSAELAKKAASVAGVDASSEAAAYAREHYRLPNLRFAQASVTALPFGDSRFDLVVAFEVIEHLEDWRGFLAEVRRVLAPSGQFVVSTPNKRYYAESRAEAGPNPFHVHEFEFAEFRSELQAIFPHISFFLENHAEGVVFQPAEPDHTSEVRIDRGHSTPEDAHFFVAVCAHRPQTGSPTFVYVPRGGNVLRERELHIEKLQAELRQKGEWLAEAQRDLAELSEKHNEALHKIVRQQADYEERTAWAQSLERELNEARELVPKLQQEVETEHRQALELAAGYEARLAEVDEEDRRKTEWARSLERELTETQRLAAENIGRLEKELSEANEELARCAALLDRAEHTVIERTRWAQDLEKQLAAARERAEAIQGSRWVKLGRALGVGPAKL